MDNKLLLLLLLFIPLLGYTEEANFELIIKYPVGSNMEEFGLSKGPNTEILPDIIKLYKDNILVSDPAKHRIVVLDKNFNISDYIGFAKSEYIKEITVNNTVSDYFSVKTNKGVYFYTKDEGKYNKIKVVQKSVFGDTFYNLEGQAIIGKYLFFFNYDNDKMYSLDFNGKFYKTNETVQILQELNKNSMTNAVKKIISSRKAIIFDKKIYATLRFPRKKIEAIDSGLDTSFFSYNITNGSGSAYYYDKDFNKVADISVKNLFQGDMVYSIESEEEWESDLQQWTCQFVHPERAPNGDFYFMRSTFKTIEFYRVKNTWDPEGRAKWEAKHSAVKNTLKKLDTSSTLTEPKDKNAYHPVKLFDHDPRTMWIEAADGPGIGESISFTFDKPISADTIRFQPGCFWGAYWKQNYRIKEMQVFLDRKQYTAKFTDTMNSQDLKLPKKTSFKEVKLVIKAVYETEKWQDTALSGVEFWLDGSEVSVDYSRFEWGLKKAQ